MLMQTKQIIGIFFFTIFLVVKVPGNVGGGMGER